MNARETVAEIAYPVTRMTLLPPIIVSWLLFSLALAFGLYGMLLFAVTLVPFIRYLMRVLVARAHGHAESPFDAELMSLIGDGWELFPLVTAAAAAWGLYLLLQTAPYALVLALAAILCLVYPASLAVLSVTRSPLQSVNPLAVYRLIRATGFDYLVLVIVLGALAVALFELRNSGVASVFIGLGLVYFMFLMYSMTGAITAQHRIADKVDTPLPLATSPQQVSAQLDRKRKRVANHAYGFISRGNREGGFAHIREHIDKDPYPGDAWPWFLREMLTWDESEPALFFAQDYLHLLLAAGDDTRALKLLTQCLFVTPRFRPAAEDREAVDQLIALHTRDDLAVQLR